jgi:hypothetical protein
MLGTKECQCCIRPGQVDCVGAIDMDKHGRSHPSVTSRQGTTRPSKIDSLPTFFSIEILSAEISKIDAHYIGW